jgi:hypothetical protein
MSVRRRSPLRTSGYRPDRLRADAQGQLEPLPTAVDVIEADPAQSRELAVDVEQAV